MMRGIGATGSAKRNYLLARLAHSVGDVEMARRCLKSGRAARDHATPINEKQFELLRDALSRTADV